MPAYGGLVRAHLALGNLDQAEAFLTAAPAAIAKSKELDAARAQLELAKQAANAGPEAELRAAVEANPNDHQARFDLAAALARRREPARKPSTSCWNSSAATGNGTTARPRPSSSPFSRR